METKQAEGSAPRQVPQKCEHVAPKQEKGEFYE